MKDEVVRCPECNGKMEVDGIGNGIQEAEYYCPRCKHAGRPDRECRMVPIVTCEHKKWFFDERVRQIRNVSNIRGDTDYYEEHLKKKEEVEGLSPLPFLIIIL